MAQRITDLKQVLDPWLEAEPDEDVRRAVLFKLAWIGENLDEVIASEALPRTHPLVRKILLDEGVVITIFLALPNRAARLMSIERVG